MTPTQKGAVLAMILTLLFIGSLWIALTRKPIVLGTECRSAEHNGDVLYLGKVDCNE